MLVVDKSFNKDLVLRHAIGTMFSHTDKELAAGKNKWIDSDSIILEERVQFYMQHSCLEWNYIGFFSRKNNRKLC